MATILLSIQDGASTKQVGNQLTVLMRERHRLPDNEDDNFSIRDTEKIDKPLSGGIGIMPVSATERTRETGILLALIACYGLASTCSPSAMCPPDARHSWIRSRRYGMSEGIG